VGKLRASRNVSECDKHDLPLKTMFGSKQ
jgi:hypothetical protein